MNVLYAMPPSLNGRMAYIPRFWVVLASITILSSTTAAPPRVQSSNRRRYRCLPGSTFHRRIGTKTSPIASLCLRWSITGYQQSTDSVRLVLHRLCMLLICQSCTPYIAPPRTVRWTSHSGENILKDYDESRTPRVMVFRNSELEAMHNPRQLTIPLFVWRLQHCNLQRIASSRTCHAYLWTHLQAVLALNFWSTYLTKARRIEQGVGWSVPNVLSNFWVERFCVNYFYIILLSHTVWPAEFLSRLLQHDIPTQYALFYPSR